VSGLLLACGASATAGALLVVWVRAMKQVSMGKRRRLLEAIAVAATILGVAAFLGEPGMVGAILAGMSILAGAGYLGLGFFVSVQSKQAPAVTVGTPLPAFSAPDENGDPFDIASLRGSPIVLKFFRGHW